VEEEEGGARRGEGEEGGGGGRGAAGSRERRGACRGEILTRTPINAPTDIQAHLGGLDDRLFFILKYLLMKKKSGLQLKGHFSHPGQKGWCLSTTRALSVHVPV